MNMASAAVETPAATLPNKCYNIHEILTCGFCQKILHKPFALPCFHNFCHGCLQKLHPLKDGTKNGHTGVHCSVCETFAKPRDFTKNYLISELIVLYKLHVTRGVKCSQCGTAKVPIEWICVQCKIALCDGCRDRHLDIPVCRLHHVVQLGDPDKLRLDGPVNCEQHPDKMLSLNCVTCRTVICKQCKVSRHDKHETESVTVALARTVQEIRTNLRKIAENDKVYQEDMFKLDIEIDNMSTQFLATIAQLTRAKEKLMHKINKDYALLILDLQSRKTAETMRINRLRYEIANKIRIRENVVSWMSTCLKLAKGTSLLIELQNNLERKVATFSTHKANGVDIGEHCSPMFVSRPESFSTDVNTLGGIMYTPANYPVPQDLQLPFRVLLNKTLTSVNEIQTNGTCYQIGLVNNAIWVPLSNKHQIEVFTLTGKPVTTISHKEIKEPLAIAQVREPDVAVACYKGLFLLDAVSGTIQTRLQKGSFCYVHTNGVIFAVLEHQTKSAYIYHWYGPTVQWRIHKEMNFNVPGMGCLSTSLVCDDFVYLCPWDGQTVYKYNHEGDIIGRYLNSQREGGQLDYPRLCCVDREGSLLVVDEHYQRLQLLTPDGKWKEIQVPGVKNPGGILVLNNSTLYILDKVGKFSTKIIRYHIPP